MPHPTTPGDIVALSADATRLARDLMRFTLDSGYVRDDLPYTAEQLRAAAALALSLGEPLAHFLEAPPED